MQPTAKIIADSISPLGKRVTSVQAEIHRDCLAELNTHRKFSRNSASSRAIPFVKMLDRVMTNPALPVLWTSEQKGMQGGRGMLDDETLELAEREWLIARDFAVRQAQRLAALGIHKQHVNRLVEPFMAHTVLITSTEWENFYAQRCSELAYPNIEAAAYAIRDAIEKSEPIELDYDEWHLPYVDPTDESLRSYSLAALIQISAMRCARTSYLTQEGVRDPEVDLTGYQRLRTATPPHWSPMEHPCTPVSTQVITGNFDGWQQLRHLRAFQ